MSDDNKWRLGWWLIVASVVCVGMSASLWAGAAWVLMAWVNVITMQVSVPKKRLPDEWKDA